MVLVGIIPFFTFALGTWQVKRLKWKVALIDDLEEKLEREPMPLPPQVKYVHVKDRLYYDLHGLSIALRPYPTSPSAKSC